MTPEQRVVAISLARGLVQRLRTKRWRSKAEQVAGMELVEAIEALLKMVEERT